MCAKYERPERKSMDLQQFNGGMWVYYRQVALLKESYLLSSLLASSAWPYFLPACLLRGRGRRLLGDDT
jgi:hypothetical protein